MTSELLKYLCEPETKEPLLLINSKLDSLGRIISGELQGSKGCSYPIINGIPRFITNSTAESVKSFGNQWNYFNYTDFKENWLRHTIGNTFGTTEVFKDRIIVDAGGGSGAQTLWMLEAGAKHVIMMELSHSVDEVVRNNLEPSGFKNFDVIQCSIDAPPLKDESINGIVLCHNVIQHTPSVEKTAKALYSLVAPGGEFVFNCYPLYTKGLLRWFRYYIVYRPLRKLLSRSPFYVILIYAKMMGILSLLPFIGIALEKLNLYMCGNVPRAKGFTENIRRRYKQTVLNTFDYFGSHTYQHHKRDDEILNLISELQPNPAKVLNKELYFRKPPAIGCALRIFK